MDGFQVTGIKLSPTIEKTKQPISNKVTAAKPATKLVTKSAIKQAMKPNAKPMPQRKSTKPVKSVVKQQTNKLPVAQKVEEYEQKTVKQEVNQPKFQMVIESPQKLEPQIHQIEVRYNHYKQKFEAKDGVLSFAPINEKYCFALAFKGNYQPALKLHPSRQLIEPETTGTAVEFTWKVKEAQVYIIDIIEDEQQESKYERKAYKAPQQPKKGRRASRTEQLTEEMKKLSVDEFGSENHKLLLEQRDLQDILYS